MSKMNSRRLSWLKKRVRTKHSLGALGKYPRLVVFKSNKHIYGQLIDDISYKTLLSASTMDKGFNKKADTKTKQSEEIGNVLAGKIKKSKIKKIVFDRNGYRFHGRVKAMVESIRDKGIEI